MSEDAATPPACAKCERTLTPDVGVPLKYPTLCNHIVCEQCFRAASLDQLCCVCSASSEFRAVLEEEAVSFARGWYCFDVLKVRVAGWLDHVRRQPLFPLPPACLPAPQNYADGVSHYEAALRLNADNYVTHLHRARCLHHQHAGSNSAERWAAVMDASLRTIDAAQKSGRGDDAESRYRLAEVFGKFGNFHAALMHISAASELLAPPAASGGGGCSCRD